MYPCLLLDARHHLCHISRLRQNIDRECQRCDPVDRNTLVDRQDIGVKLCHRLEHNRQQPRLIVQLMTMVIVFPFAVS